MSAPAGFPSPCCVQAAAKCGFQSIVLWLDRAVISLTAAGSWNSMFGVKSGSQAWLCDHRSKGSSVLCT